MSEETLRAQLNKTRAASKRLRHDKERREALFTRATKTTSALDPNKTKGGTADRELILADLADLDTIIEAETAYLSGLRRQTMRLLESAELERDELEVMRKRYIDCLKWEEIAGFMYWSIRHVQRLHGSALVKLDAVWHTLSRSDTQET